MRTMKTSKFISWKKSISRSSRRVVRRSSTKTVRRGRRSSYRRIVRRVKLPKNASMFIKKFKGSRKQMTGLQYIMGYYYKTNRKYYNTIWKQVGSGNKKQIARWSKYFYTTVYKTRFFKKWYKSIIIKTGSTNKTLSKSYKRSSKSINLT